VGYRQRIFASEECKGKVMMDTKDHDGHNVEVSAPVVLVV
jgi:hypothetical protein